MVWALRAVDPAHAPSTYYLKSATTHSVGRRDCYITIPADKTISRLHAKLIAEEAKAPKTGINDIANIPRMPLRVHDLSKFGTFVNKQPGSKPLNSVPGCEASVNDGDIVTFGTNKTSFRVEFIPFFLCISGPLVGRENPTIKAALRHGAYAVQSWKEACTHVLVDEGATINEMVIAAVAFNKPVLQIHWWQKFSLETQVVTELLPYSSYLPTLVFQGSGSSTPVKIALPDLRKSILQDYSFFLGPIDMYEYGNYLIRLLEAAGGTVEFISKTSSTISTGTRQQMVVKPRDGTGKEGWASPGFLNKVTHHPRTSEDKLVLAVLAGYVDATSLPLPSSPVASADSDETREELDETREESDEDEVQDTADTLSFKNFEVTSPPSPPKAEIHPAGTSAHIPIDLDEEDSPIVFVKRTPKRSRQHETYSAEPNGSTEALDDNNVQRQKVNHQKCVTETPGLIDSLDYKSILYTEEPSIPSSLEVLEPIEQTTRGRKRASMTIDKFFSQHETKKLHLIPEVSDSKTWKVLATQGGDPPFIVSSTKETRAETKPKAELLSNSMVSDSSAATEPLIVFSQLVVRMNAELVPFPRTPIRGSAPNFKRFKKKGLGTGVSGNTFTTLVPFAKEPYRESDLGRGKNEFMQEEQRRKDAERIAEDLFNNEKLKSATTSKSRGRGKK